MSDLAERLGLGDSGVIAGYQIVPASFTAIAEAEKAFETRHMQTAGRAAEELSNRAAELVIAKAHQDVADGMFTYGSVGFANRAMSNANLPLLLSLCAKSDDPGTPPLTEAKAATLLTRENRNQVWQAIMKSFGYAKEKTAESPKNAPAAGGSGAASATPSEPAASPTPTSPA